MATFRGIPLSKISPQFLHANSTSHTWPFSAIAELIDNAYDPDVAASELHINKTVICGKPCLIFEDNGNGMDHEHLLKMLSFGYCEKEQYENRPAHLPIGHYGNGFKSGSMRLAEDALVFTLCDISASVGFLSQTYLKTIKSDSVVIPMLEFRLPNLERIKSQESRNNLDAILKHTPFKTEQDIKEELRSINRNRTGTGTKIILYNLKRLKNGKLELDFESVTADIRNPEAHEVDLTSVYHRTSHVETSEYVQSLRTYCSILFLRPRMKIYIRGVRVKSKLISKSLSQTEIDVYKPTWMERPLKITFGFVCNKDYNKEDYGVMFYHRNRLIKPYEKLGYQKQPNELGVGVVGVVQVDFLKPIHNKQDFQKDEKYNAIMSAIALKLNDYWNEKKSGKEVKDFGNIRTTLPDWLWVQCERCLKWRRLPDGVRSSPLPDQWYCHMNPDPTHNRCDIPEEPEDEDQAVQRPTYAKTFKKQIEERKRRKQADINAKEAELKVKEAELLERQRQQQLNEVSSSQESSRSIANLQKALMEARKREEAHKRLILQIQNQKKQLELQHQSLLQAANSLQNTNTNTAELLQVAAALTGESPVSSTSGKGGKRKTLDLGEGGGKRIDIKMETGEMVSIERNDDGEDEEMLPADQTSFLEPYTSSPNVNAAAFSSTTNSSPLAINGVTSRNISSVSFSASPIHLSSTKDAKSIASRRRSRPQPAVEPLDANAVVIDLTGEKIRSSSSLNSPVVLESEDVKPDMSEFNLANETTNSGQRKGSAGSQGEGDPLTGPGMLLSNNKRVVNVKVEEQETRYTQLKQKYELLQKRFGVLQKNIHKLLSFIVPDVDLGNEEDIEVIVTEMIRVNCAQEEKA